MMRRWRKTRAIGLCDPQINPHYSPETDWPADGLLRLLSFNVQVGINTQRYHHYLTRSWQHLLPHAGRANNLQRIADLLADFDLVALQEVDGGSLRSGYVNQVEYLAQQGAFPYWYQQLNRNLGRFAQHSNGVLSRLAYLAGGSSVARPAWAGGDLSASGGRRAGAGCGDDASGAWRPYPYSAAGLHPRAGQ